MTAPNLSALISSSVARAARDDDGQGLVEYALIFVLIVIVAILSLIFFGTSVSSLLSQIGTSI